MFTQQTKLWLIQEILLVVAIVGCAVLTGCQTHPYSKLENLEDKVYNCVDKFSREIPKEFVNEGDDGYRDPALDLPERGKGRMVSCFGSSTRHFFAGYFDMDDIGSDSWLDREINPYSAIIFGATFGEIMPASDMHDVDVNERYYNMVESSILCGAGKTCVWYFKKNIDSDWRKCQIDITGFMEFRNDQMRRCEEDAETVPKEQVQRYIDLAERFFNTYSCKD